MKKTLPAPEPKTVHHLRPTGHIGRMAMSYTHDPADGSLILGDDPNGPRVTLDWHNDRLQILVYDGQQDEPTLKVRFGVEERIREILYNREASRNARLETLNTTPWEEERDDHHLD